MLCLAKVIFLSGIMGLFPGIPAARPENMFSEARVTYQEPEAQKWLEGSSGEMLFAPKRFSDLKAARRFVSRLYAAGAIYVGVVFTMQEANGLKVYLPLDFDKREEIFSIANRELVQAGFRTETDQGQDTLTIWF
jgi:hypothetical protein